MPSYLSPTDPALAKSILETNWHAFFEAMERTTPEFISSLRGKTLELLASLAGEYNKISEYPLGSLTCMWDGRPALAARPLGDLAMLICDPDRKKPDNPWPPSAFLWDKAIRAELLELSTAMRDWAVNFRASESPRKYPHWRVINVGLETMRAWLEDPVTANNGLWYGHSKVIESRVVEPGKFAFSIDGWDSTGPETEVEFRGRVNDLAGELSAWAMEEIRLSKAGEVNLNTKRNPEHFDWAALRLVHELAYPKIADTWSQTKPDANLDDGTVRKGVQTTLKALGLIDIGTKRK